jgi:hypothetical protein
MPYVGLAEHVFVHLELGSIDQRPFVWKGYRRAAAVVMSWPGDLLLIIVIVAGVLLVS